MTEAPPEGGRSLDPLGSDQADDQADAEAADLQGSIAGLASLITGSLGLDELPTRVATFATSAIPGADGAGVTLLNVDGSVHRVDALAASHPFVTEIDEIQYVTVKEGPCITAALERRTVRSGSLGGEKMCPAIRTASDASVCTTEKYLHTLPDADDTALDALRRTRTRTAR